MKLLIPPPTRIHQVVLILALVCLLATFTGVILVAAHNDNANPQPPAPDQVTAETQEALILNF